MVARILFERRCNAFSAKRVDDLLRSLAYVAQKPAGGTRLLAAKRKIRAPNRASKAMFTRKLGETRIPKRARNASKAIERKAFKRCPRSKQTRKRIPCDNSFARRFLKILLNGRDNPTLKQPQLRLRIAGKRSIISKEPRTLPRRKVVIPITRPDSRKRKPSTTKLSALLPNIAAIALDNMQIHHAIQMQLAVAFWNVQGNMISVNIECAGHSITFHHSQTNMPQFFQTRPPGFNAKRAQAEIRNAREASK